MALSYVLYSGNGVTTTRSVPFGYLDQSHVTVEVGGVSTSFTWLTASTISISPAPAAGTNNIRVLRTTPRSAAQVDWTNGSTLVDTDLDTDTLQMLYICQEVIDTLDRRLPLATDDLSWDADSKQIKDVDDPTAAQDAVTLAYLQANYVNAAVTMGTGVAAFLGTPSSVNLKAAITDEVGAGSLLFGDQAVSAASSPTFAAPFVTSLNVGAGGATDTTITRASAGQIAVEGVNVLMSGGALGTPSSGTLTNATGLPIAGITGLAANVATFLATPSSANLAAAVTDEAGSGALYLTNGALGTPASGTLTNCGGLPASGTTNLTTVSAVQHATLALGGALTEGVLQISPGAAGVVVAHGNADELVVEGSAATGISILSPNVSTASLFFGSPADSIGATVEWDYTNLSMFVGSHIAGGKVIFRADDAAEAMRIIGASGQSKVLIGATTSSGISQGLHIDQGTNDDSILGLSSTDVAHGMTVDAPTSRYSDFRKTEATNGGLTMRGFSAGTYGIQIHGICTTGNSTHTTSGVAPIMTGSFVKSGTSFTNLTTENIFALAANGTKFIVAADGKYYADSTFTEYDEFDDDAVLKDVNDLFALNRTGVAPEQAHLDRMSAAGLIDADFTTARAESGERALVCQNVLIAVQNGAHLQRKTRENLMHEVLAELHPEYATRFATKAEGRNIGKMPAPITAAVAIAAEATP